MTGPAAVVPGRLGVLGGTFDPIHLGHLAVAEAARDELGLERVLFVPARIPPHRSTAPGATAEDRAAMVTLAIAGNPAFAMSSIELERDGPSFTADTVERLADDERAAGREPDLWFIVSTEAFEDFLNWRQPDRILGAARLAVLPREGHAPPDLAPLRAALPGQADRMVALDGPRVRVSATEIRVRAGRGLSVRYLVPDAVATYIVDHRLYQAVPGAATQLPGGTIVP